MTDAQLLALLGAVWVAPHVNKWYAQITGAVFAVLGICKGLGWI